MGNCSVAHGIRLTFRSLTRVRNLNGMVRVTLSHTLCVVPSLSHSQNSFVLANQNEISLLLLFHKIT